jgi:hypothetical protein
MHPLRLFWLLMRETPAALGKAPPLLLMTPSLGLPVACPVGFFFFTESDYMRFDVCVSPRHLERCGLDSRLGRCTCTFGGEDHAHRSPSDAWFEW